MALFYDNPRLRDCWFVVASDLEVTNGVISRRLLGENLVLYRDTAGAVVVAPDRCPHREAPLSAGKVDDGVLSCCYHGWSFGGQGQCVAIPSADPDFPIPDKAHLRPFPAEVRYGLVWVCLGQPASAIPKIKQEDDSVFRRINNPVDVWQVSATRMTDNFLDTAHFPWVHTGTFGNSQRTLVEKIQLEDLTGGFYGYAYGVVADNPPSANLASGEQGNDVERTMTTGFALPFVVRSTIKYSSGLEHIILLLSTPLDDVTSYFTFVVWRNDDFSVASEDAIFFDRMIGAEDKKMLEKIPGVLALQQGALASTQSDKPSTAWRLQLVKFLEGQ